MRILVVEDDPRIQADYEEGLSDARAEYISVSSRAEAMEVLDKWCFEGAIIDLQLTGDPGYHQGIEVLEYIGRQGEGTRALVVSGTPNPVDVKRSFNTGALDVILKDTNLEDGRRFSFMLVAEEFAKKCATVKLSNFGSNDTLASYLASPDLAPYWESYCRQILGVPFPDSNYAISKAFGAIAPFLRRRDSQVALNANAQDGSLSGAFWSKRLGRAVTVDIFNTKVTRAPQGGVEAEVLKKFRVGKKVEVRISATNEFNRVDFCKFVGEKSWLSQ